MIKPPHKPRIEHKNDFQTSPSYSLNDKVSGIATALAKYNKGVNKTVEIISYHFKVDSILSFWLTDIILVAKKLVKNDP